jgi:glycosyltransferase involved in cell wall biosynthesis
MLYSALEDFRPQIVHSHHPFLLGDSALRLAAARGVPIVFTHHTQYEKYTHYVPGHSTAMQRFAVDLATGYCNLCDAVIAPSESIAEMLRGQGVQTRIEVVPTGVDVRRLMSGTRGTRKDARDRLGLPTRGFVVGHVGRLAPEKNLAFLAEAVARFLAQRPDARFLVAGAGPSEADLRAVLTRHDVADRLHMAGVLERDALADAYRAMDVFAFASQSETQGMVLTEAMTFGVPVVAVDACGVREVAADRRNGRLLASEHAEKFAAALVEIATANAARRAKLRKAALATAEEFSIARCAAKALTLYEQLIAQGGVPRDLQDSLWHATLRWLDREWRIFANFAGAVGGAVAGPRK